jgi:hypothetical protein
MVTIQDKTETKVDTTMSAGQKVVIKKDEP